MRILVVSTDWSGLISPIIDEMRAQGHYVDYLDHSMLSNFCYFNAFDKIQSKIFNLFSSGKYKHLRTNEQVECTLRGFFCYREPYDLALFTNPDIFNEQHFKIFRANSKKMFLNLWDSLDRMPKNKLKLHFFDVVRSFDPVDCSSLNLLPSINYFNINEREMPSREHYDYDVFLVMTFCRQRYSIIDKIICRNKNLNFKIMIYIDHERKRKFITNPKIEVITKPLFGEQLRTIIENSKAVLDIGYENQNGLSFRVMETLAWNKKLITTNKNILGVDFYDKNNILLLDDKFFVGDEFLDSSYVMVDDKVKSKYRLDAWVKHLLSLM